MEAATEKSRASAASPNAPQPGRGKVWAIVDVSNAARGSTTPGLKFRLMNLLAIFALLDAAGVGHDAIADASLRHRIDDSDGLNRLFTAGRILQAPAGCEADPFIIQLARKRREQGYEVYLVTNDQYKEHRHGNGFPHIGFIVTTEGWVLSWPEIQTLAGRTEGAGSEGVPSPSTNQFTGTMEEAI